MVFPIFHARVIANGIDKDYSEDSASGYFILFLPFFLSFFFFFLPNYLDNLNLH